MLTEERTSQISAPRLAGAGALLAISFCILLYDNLFKLIPLGLNVPLYLVIFYLSLGLALGKQFVCGLRSTVVHLISIALLCIPFVLTSNPLLLTINAILILLFAAEQAMLCMKKTLYDPYSVRFIGDSLTGLFTFSFGGVGGAFTTYKNGGKNRFVGIFIGVAVTIPVLLAVIPLLLSGDAVFNKFFMDAFGNLQLSDAIGYALVALLLFVLGSGFLWSLAAKQRKKPPAPPVYAQQQPYTQPPVTYAQSAPAQKQPVYFNLTASFFVLVALSLVLVAFCMVQFLYLFSGNVPDGFTYAEYARSGFWQLLAVAVIVITLVFLLLRFGAPCSFSASVARKVLMTLLLVCTLILLVSAFSRMTLYEQSFGFSQLRLFTQFFMAALFLFLLFAILRLWLPRLDLKKCAFFCFLGVYIVLTLFNIDAFIARENIKNQGAQADITYLSTLSADALPYYIDMLDPAYFATEVIPEKDYDYDARPSFSYVDSGRDGNLNMLLYKEEVALY
ncbi:MAG: DUF4173 domain-containing protein, partial [Christensenella sp.]|uniref:DUF4153 domain-containing protein n=1 Tax=Christensenella sp. TaxID=1935934 RepID=UPI002B2176F1